MESGLEIRLTIIINIIKQSRKCLHVPHCTFYDSYTDTHTHTHTYKLVTYNMCSTAILMIQQQRCEMHTKQLLLAHSTVSD